MAMEEFRKAVISPDNIEISVEKHKTADDYGNAGNIIPRQVYEWQKLYLITRNQRLYKVTFYLLCGVVNPLLPVTSVTEFTPNG